MDAFMRSGSPKEIYHAAGFDRGWIAGKIP